MDTLVSMGSTSRSVLLEHKCRLEGGQGPAAPVHRAQGHPEWGLSFAEPQAPLWVALTLGGYNLAGCCRDSGGMRMSSKNPRETRENREVTAWDRDSQWTVKPRRVWILKRQAPYRVLPMGQLSSWKTGSLSHLKSPKPLSMPLTV